MLQSESPLPIGDWKGAGLALLLGSDASVLSAGEATFPISAREEETGVPQVFLAFDLRATGTSAEPIVGQIVEDARRARPLPPEAPVAVPEQRTAGRRRKSDAEGIVVDEESWRRVKAL